MEFFEWLAVHYKDVTELSGESVDPDEITLLAFRFDRSDGQKVTKEMSIYATEDRFSWGVGHLGDLRRR